MNPMSMQDGRRVIWTVSVSRTDRYCLYVDGWLYAENLALDDFYPLYKRISG